MDINLQRQIRTIAYLLTTMAALYVYSRMWEVRTDDWKEFFAPYIHQMRNPSYGALPLGTKYGNSAPAFTLFLYFVSLLPLKALTAFKFCTFLFVCFSAFLASRFVRRLGCGKNLALLAYWVFLFVPAAWLNSAAWGQSDAIYTSFLMAALYCMTAKRPIARHITNEPLALLMFGVAFSFKLQSVFFVIALAHYFISVPRARLFFWVLPLPYIVSALPIHLSGISWHWILDTYLRQSTVYRFLTFAAPSIWSVLPRLDYNYWSWIGMFAAMALVVMCSLYLIYFPIPRTPINSVRIAFISCLLIPYILPNMHERYFYGAELFGILLAFSSRRYMAVSCALCLISSLSYAGYFRHNQSLNFSVPVHQLGIAMSLLVVAVLVQIGGRLFRDGLEKSMHDRSRAYLDQRMEVH
jgi:Gpi18-like mannosyltransferase